MSEHEFGDDVPERQQTQRRMDELFRALVENALDVITIIDAEGVIHYESPSIERVLGYKPAELIGVNIVEMIHPDDAPKVNVAIKAIAPPNGTPGIAQVVEARVRHKDGSWRILEAIGKALPGGMPVTGIVFNSRDITERKEAENTLRESERHLRHSQQIAHLGSWRLDVATNQVMWTEELYHMYGFDPALPPPPYTEHMKLFTPASWEMLSASLANTRETGIPYVLELETVKKDGSNGWMWVMGEVTKDSDANTIGLWGAAQDITERKQTEKHIQTQLQRLAALRTIDTAIVGSIDLRLTLNVVVRETVVHLGVDAVAVLLLNPHTQTLTYAAGCGFRGKAIERSRLRLGEGLAGRAALERHVVSIHNVRETATGVIRADVLAEEDFVCYHAAPLIAKGQVQGVLEIFVRSHRDTDEDWIEFFEMLTQQAAIALDNAQLFDNLQRSIVDLSLAYNATIEGWSRALDLRDKETEGHTLRVTEMTEDLALTMGIGDEELVHIRRGALLHDIGKMGVPDGILLKPGKLTDEEWEKMIKHPQFAYDMLAPIAYLKPALDIPYCHHEKWDGTGYPRGLKGDQIPLAARLFAIVDVWDALRSDRPYRQGWTKEKTLEHIKSLNGSHFDPKVVQVFLRLTNEKGILGSGLHT